MHPYHRDSSRCFFKRSGSVPTRTLNRLRVSAIAGLKSRGKLLAGTLVIPCVLGPTGIVMQKREGDGATPAGRFGLDALMFRPDRGSKPLSGLASRALHRRDGWCDDPASARYNKPVVLPILGGHERLWRRDRLYDLLVVLGYNRLPVRKARGSAIFLHVWNSPNAPTAGCVAIDAAALRRLLTRVGPATLMTIA